jgi:RNA polymerase sigma-70 factor (ECF subfamily)
MANLAARLVGNADRDDLVQEALSRAWRRWETYKPERGTPQTWLLAIVADRARRAHRRRVATAAWSGQERSAPREADLDLERAIQGLPKRQRLAVELHYFVGLTTAETASVMSCAEGTVKSALYDARSNLRRDLEQQ